MLRGALSCLVVARWGLHGSNSADGYTFVGRFEWNSVPRVAFLGPTGARWGPFGHLRNEDSRLRRCRWAVRSDIIQYPAINWQYPVADREEISGPGRRSAKYVARTMKFMCLGRHEIIDFRTKSLEIPEWELFLEKFTEIGRPEPGGRNPVPAWPEPGGRNPVPGRSRVAGTRSRLAGNPRENVVQIY